jgi:hypothetical protein
MNRSLSVREHAFLFDTKHCAVCDPKLAHLFEGYLVSKIIHLERIQWLFSSCHIALQDTNSPLLIVIIDVPQPDELDLSLIFIPSELHVLLLPIAFLDPNSSRLRVFYRSIALL